MGEFEGLVAVVTGAASGIGFAAARLLNARGARVVGLDVAPEPLTGTELHGLRCDVTDADEVRAAIGTVRERFGRLDVLVNNAGIGAQGDVTADPDEEWHHVFNVNVVGVARVSRAALEPLRASGSAAIVNTASIAGVAGLPQRALYSATKGAVHSLTLAMAADHLADGIRVNCVAPGTTDTPWVGRLLDRAADPVAERRALEARQPSGRLVTADEVAHAIVHLASPRASATTGTVVNVDGGMFGLRHATAPAG